jgi:hypothetical protein
MGKEGKVMQKAIYIFLIAIALGGCAANQYYDHNKPMTKEDRVYWDRYYEGFNVGFAKGLEECRK